MPATISGAVGVLWTNVLVNDSTGLGALWSPIMVLKVLSNFFIAFAVCYNLMYYYWYYYVTCF